jgi:hypothetical protein
MTIIQAILWRVLYLGPRPRQIISVVMSDESTNNMQHQHAVHSHFLVRVFYGKKMSLIGIRAHSFWKAALNAMVAIGICS